MVHAPRGNRTPSGLATVTSTINMHGFGSHFTIDACKCMIVDALYCLWFRCIGEWKDMGWHRYRREVSDGVNLYDRGEARGITCGDSG